MPTLMSISVPALTQGPSSNENLGKKRAMSTSSDHGPRMYSEEPLPFRLSNIAPVNARIASRELHSRGASYSVKIGEVEIHNVGIDEILDYVSAQHLEDYEFQQFEEQAELERIAEIAEDRLEGERRERRKEQAKNNGTILAQGIPDPRDAALHTADNVAGVRVGRARPTYKHVFKLHKERRRRKRDPKTNELMPLSDEESPDATAASEMAEHNERNSIRASQNAPDLPKRRRRKRDPATGKLMPLPPIVQHTSIQQSSTPREKAKRPRRKRHPDTGELMPLGWRYDLKPVSPSMKSLSISQEPAAKRARLSYHSSSAPSSSGSLHALPQTESITSSGSESSEDEDDDHTGSLGRHILQTVQKPPGMLDTRPEGGPFSRERNTMTSMLSSNAKTTGRLHIREDTEDTEDWGDTEDDDGEYTIETIMAHHLSDPRTHPPDLGSRPVMLYQVKWEGFEDPTWEPAVSFSDASVLEEYQRRVGLIRDDDENADDDEDMDERA